MKAAENRAGVHSKNCIVGWRLSPILEIVNFDYLGGVGVALPEICVSPYQRIIKWSVSTLFYFDTS